ncbi:MAG: hypothetical protein LBB29_00395 [Holosporaceae bacterium]|jgi:hypothetical protein|nr:hypothetical protein [Holosporaceae bacterium]
MKITFALILGLYLWNTSVVACSSGWPYGFDEEVLKKSDAVLPNANRGCSNWEGYYDGTNASFLHFYVFPYMAALLDSIDRRMYFQLGKISDAPLISEECSALLDVLRSKEKILVDAFKQVPFREINAETTLDSQAFKNKCDKVADALPFPSCIRSHIKDVIDAALREGRICVGPRGSEAITKFQEEHFLSEWNFGCSFYGTINAWGETISDLISVVFHESGHSAAFSLLNCANQGEFFSMFFQIAAFSAAVKQGIINKTEAERVVRAFLGCLFIEQRILNSNAEICQKNLFSLEDEFDIKKYQDMLLKVFEPGILAAQEEEKFFHDADISISSYWKNEKFSDDLDDASTSSYWKNEKTPDDLDTSTSSYWGGEKFSDDLDNASTSSYWDNKIGSRVD